MFRLTVWIPLVAFALLSGCGESRRTTPKPDTTAPANSTPEARLIFLTDLEGYLEPCGCQSTSLGGIDRAAAAIALLHQDRTPTLIIASGDIFFESGAGHQRSDDQAKTQECWKAEAMVQVFERLGVQLAASGRGDLRYGPPQLQSLTQSAAIPWYGPGLAKTGPRGTHLLRIGPLQVGLAVWSAAENESGRPIGAGISKLAAQLRNQGADLVIALLDADSRAIRQATAAMSSVDFAVGTGKDRDDPSPPEKLGSTILLSGGRHGRGLLVLEPSLSSPGQPFVDNSAWTREASQDARKANAENLARRIQAWEQDPSVDKALLTEQRIRLAHLLRPVGPSNSETGSNNFRARYVPLTTEAPKDPAVTQLMADYDARVNQHNRSAFADQKPPSVKPGQAGYLGSQACSGCHPAAYQWWQGHAHGRAYDTLVTRNKQFNLSCVGCHVTGYGKPGGSTVAHTEGLQHVGCESCHGPGSLHVADSSKIVTTPRETTCVACHSPEHSDLFDYVTYRARLRSPGHGLPAQGPKTQAKP